VIPDRRTGDKLGGKKKAQAPDRGLGLFVVLFVVLFVGPVSLPSAWGRASRRWPNPFHFIHGVRGALKGNGDS
jgi:hypothetical protein